LKAADLTAGEQDEMFTLAIFTLSSGLSTCGSSDTKKKEKDSRV
jgi:hypothetical protein